MRARVAVVCYLYVAFVLVNSLAELMLQNHKITLSRSKVQSINGREIFIFSS